MSDVLSLDIQDSIARVTLNRPEVMNALNRELFEALSEVGLSLKSDNKVRAVVMDSSGPSFCVGLDVSVFSESSGSSMLEVRNYGLTNILQHTAWVWHEIPVPVITAIKGHCLGGGLQLACGADMRFVHPEAKLSILEIKWGIVPDMAGSQLWKRFVREDLLRDLTYTGRIFSGKEAFQYGFATRLCEDPLADALEAASQVAGKNPHAIRANKRIINQQAQASPAEGMLFETIEQLAIAGTPNQAEAIQANLEKRAPVFVDPES